MATECNQPTFEFHGLRSGADRIVGGDKTRNAPRRCGLCGHDVTPDQGGSRLPWDRNCELAFVNLPRQFDADNHASRIVERLESQHRAQAPLHPAMILLHNVVQIRVHLNKGTKSVIAITVNLCCL